MVDKKYNQLQRIKTLEKTVSMLWKLMQLQGEKLNELTDGK